MAKKISRSDLRFRQNLWSKVRYPHTSDLANNITKDKRFTTKSKRFTTKCKACYAPKPHIGSLAAASVLSCPPGPLAFPAGVLFVSRPFAFGVPFVSPRSCP